MLLEAFARKMLLAPMLAVLAGLPGSEAASPPLSPPHALYACGLTRISKSGTRLEDARTRLPIPGSGSAIWFENGGYQVSYDKIPAIHRAQPGDPAFMCLVHLPPECPPGDERGRVFTTTDLRTLESWTLANSEHSCGGA